MGCFSFLCQECGKGIRSTSFSGEQCELALLRKGEVIQRMRGEYDSYGRVFIDGTSCPDNPSLRESVQWENPTPDIPLPEGHDEHDIWSRVCDLMFDDDDTSGIAAVHLKCLGDDQFEPTHQSESDPNQGWGEDNELMGNCDPDYQFDDDDSEFFDDDDSEFFDDEDEEGFDDDLDDDEQEYK